MFVRRIKVVSIQITSFVNFSYVIWRKRYAKAAGFITPTVKPKCCPSKIPLKIKVITYMIIKANNQQSELLLIYNMLDEAFKFNLIE